MSSEQELIEATIYLLADSVIAVHSAFQSDEFKKMLVHFTVLQREAYYSMYTLIESTIIFAKKIKPTVKNYNTLIDNTDSIQEFIVKIVVNSEKIPQFEFFRNFYNYYKKIQTSLNN